MPASGMQIYLLCKGHTPKRLEDVERLPEKGYLWLDLRRDESSVWPDIVHKLTGVTVQESHCLECQNAGASSFFDGTNDYDMLVFQGLGPDDSKVETRSAAFLIFDRLLVTIHEPDSRSFTIVKERFEAERQKSPEEPLGLALLILDTMVDRYLGIRGRMVDRLERLESDLLDQEASFEDVRSLLMHRRHLRKLEMIGNDQLEGLESWRRATRVQLTNRQLTRMVDLREHVQQVLTHVESQQNDIEAAVQLHYSMVTNRTNRIVKTLTVVSAVFLPLSFIAGVFGMNFEHMPELRWQYGYYLALGGMTIVAGVMLLIFRRRGYF